MPVILSRRARMRIRTGGSRVCAVENSVLASACTDGGKTGALKLFHTRVVTFIQIPMNTFGMSTTAQCVLAARPRIPPLTYF